jgi:dUTP pyrophosphatase
MSEPPRSKRSVLLRVLRLPHGQGLPLPSYHSKVAAGLDIVAAVPETEPLELLSGTRALVPTGFALELAEGYEAQLRPRSGLALKHGLTLLNSPGTIDADYRGEVQVLLVNHGTAPFTVARGMRIAQMIVAPVTRGRWREVETLPKSERGAGGFGSTGTETKR